MEHSFDINIAKEYGITEAILLKNIYFWVKKNALNKTNAQDGRYWTFNSVKAFSGFFPYLNERQIKYALKKLKDCGLIITGVYNSDKRLRTLWYTLSDEALILLGENPENFVAKDVSDDSTEQSQQPDKNVKCKEQNCTIELDKNVQADSTKLSDTLDKNVKCTYTDINTDINADSNITARARKENSEKAANKIAYADDVLLTETEYSALIAKLGSKQAADECIEILSNYKGATGRKYKSDYKAILNWVVDKYRERHKTPTRAQPGTQNDPVSAAARVKALLAARQQRSESNANGYSS